MKSKPLKEMFLFAGPNGSGKSTIVKKFLAEKNCPTYYICPDNNLDEKLKNNKEAYIKAMQLAELQRYKAIAENKSFSFESVFSTTAKLDFLKFAKIQGYKITAVYIVTKNPEINIRRIRERVKCGGHAVPKDKIVSRYYKSLNLMHDCLAVADNFFLFDNSEETPNKPQLVLEKHKSKIAINSNYKNFVWLRKYLGNIQYVGKFFCAQIET
jgi:predicted ABC-type ATPase